jgi:hypothetical protein
MSRVVAPPAATMTNARLPSSPAPGVCVPKASGVAPLVDAEHGVADPAGSSARIHPKRVANRRELPVRMQEVARRHPASDEVLEDVVAVDASPVLAELRDPRPHPADPRGRAVEAAEMGARRQAKQYFASGIRGR